MKILMVNKFYHVVGGSETYYFALRKLLESKGHEVIDFSMQDEQNKPSKYQDYFVNNIDYKKIKGIGAKIKASRNIIYSKEAKEKFERLIIETNPDLIHLHLFQHQISPSILDVVKKYNIPTVYTAHELKMICPNYRMFHHGRLCEACKGEKYYHCILNRCVKDSFTMSVVSSLEAYFHKMRHSYDAIDKIITPSAFYKSKFEEFGIQKDRVCHISNFLESEVPLINKRTDSEEYYLYFGRLSSEKGLYTLIKSFEQNGKTLYIAGTGDMMDDMKKYIKSKGLKNIILFGFISGQNLIDLVGNAKAVILSSEWYENGPYSAIEALQLKRPIIGTDIGGIPELVDNNGFLFEKGNIDQLNECINKFESMTSEEYESMKQASFRLFEREYISSVHYKKLLSVYKEAIKMRRRHVK